MKSEVLEKKAAEIRKTLLTMIYNSKAGHTGGALSVTDILVTLFYDVMTVFPNDPKNKDRDYFVLSKGHSTEPYYCILADLGFFPKEKLDTFHLFGTKLIGHPNNQVPGVEVNTGALGHGLSIAVGTALASKLDKAPNRTFVVMGDGEQAEGSIWEAAMAAAHYELDNLYGVIDRNRLQITGGTEEVMALDNLKDKWEAFGWDVYTCDGHSITALQSTFEAMEKTTGKPKLLIADTVKGKGVSYMENVASWHHGVPSEEQYQQAIKELEGVEA